MISITFLEYKGQEQRFHQKCVLSTLKLSDPEPASHHYRDPIGRPFLG